jgi:hypothetical protein
MMRNEHPMPAPDAMKLWRVHFDVTVQEHGKKPKRHRRCLLVAAEDEDTAETIARPHATKFNFGPRVLEVDWRQTSSVSLPLDLSALFGGTPEVKFVLRDGEKESSHA